MKAHISTIALLAISLSACRHSSYDFASSTVAKLGPELETVAKDLSKCPPGSYVDGLEQYGKTGERCVVGAKGDAVRSVLQSAQIYWVVIGGKGEPTIFAIRDKRKLFFGPIGALYYTPTPWTKEEIEKTGHIAIGNCPCKWFYQDS